MNVRNCRKCGKIFNYIAGPFVCPACREELEIYYTVSVGLRQLDSGNGVYDIAGSLEESMENAWLTVRTARLRKVICYAANTLNVASVLIMLFMQIRIWIQG